MSKNLKIKGVLGVNVTSEDVNFLLIPDIAYLSPDKATAILYGEKDNIRQIALETGCLKLTLSPELQAKEAILMQIALQQKPIELHISDNESAIVGFSYPTSRS